MKILVTGGAGYIGSVIVNSALQRGLDVRVVDALWYDPKVPLAHLNNPRYEFVRGDITDGPLMDRCLEGVDFVIHTAAVVGEPASNKFPELTEKVNSKGAIGLIDRVKGKGVHGFIFLSTCSNYGVSDGLANELTVLKPLSLYARTKVDVERHLMDNVRHTDWVICRLSTAYGSSPRMRFDLTVNDFAMNAFMKKYLDIYLPYTYRPYVHTYDIANVILGMADNFNLVRNDIFNVGFNEENYQKMRIAETVREFIPDLNIEAVDKGADMRDYRVDFSKLNNFLNVAKTYTVRDGVREVIQMLSSGLVRDCGGPSYYNTSPDFDTEGVTIDAAS
ncbi:MAG: NAD(P)-dependent oxidoreductase [Candidatus Omnitrophota bacterium]